MCQRLNGTSPELTKAGGQRLYGHGAVADLHVYWTRDVYKQRGHVQLRALVLQRRVSVQDAEGVLVLVDSVGVWQRLVVTLSRAGMVKMLLVLHRQVCVALCGRAARNDFWKQAVERWLNSSCIYCVNTSRGTNDNIIITSFITYLLFLINAKEIVKNVEKYFFVSFLIFQ